KGIVLGVSGLPESVSLGKFLWRKRGKSQQVVRPVFNHIDPQVVPCVYAKVWPVCIAKGESFKFQKTVEGGVFHTLNLWDVHQAPDSLRVVDFTVRSKHRAQFERQHMWIVSTCVAIDLGYACRRLTVHASRLEQDRYAIKTNDAVYLPAIKRDSVVSGVMLNVRSGNKRNSFAESLPRPIQHLLLFRIAQVIDVAGVHVHGIHEPGFMGGRQLLRKCLDSDPAVWLVREQGGCHALHFASWLLALEQLVNFHA